MFWAICPPMLSGTVERAKKKDKKERDKRSGKRQVGKREQTGWIPADVAYKLVTYLSERSDNMHSKWA